MPVTRRAARLKRALAELPSIVYWEGRHVVRAARRFLLPVRWCRVGGVRVALVVSSSSEHYRADTYATKEPETIEWLRARLEDDDVLFDVGANVGLYSLYAAKLRPGCRVYAFEPESHSFSSLTRNILVNRLENVTPCSLALSDRESFELFHVYGQEPGSALHSLGAPSELRSEPPTIRQGTVATTLDRLVFSHGLPHPTLLKIDVDGIEERILDGAGAMLASGKVRSILVEVTRRGEAETTWAERRLAAFGYSLTARSAWTIELRGLRSQNYVFDR